MLTKKILSPLILLLILVSLITEVSRLYALTVSSKTISSSGSITSIDPTTITFVVALDGSGDFRDIQSAINAIPSMAKGVIVIKAGLYDLNPNYRYPYKSIVVRSDLTLRGAGIDKTIIRSFPQKQPAGSSIRAPTIYAPQGVKNLVIEDLTVTQNGSPDNAGWSAIDLRSSNTNVAIRRVKVTDVTGAAVGISRFSGITIDNCVIERAWTAINALGGTTGTIKGNRIINATGDGIFPQAFKSYNLSVTDLIIEDNYLENIGDTGIDITSLNGAPPHERIIARRNTLINAHFRVSLAQHIKILDNVVEYGKGWIDVDSGQGKPIDIVIEGNRVTSSRKAGIGVYGAQDCVIRNNNVTMLTPPSGTIQSGISAGAYGNLTIENNRIVNAANYGIDFGNWGISSHQVTIRNNTIIDFGDIGIYDNAKGQGSILVEGNVIWDRRTPFVSRYGIRTDYESNVWTIRYNRVYAGRIAYISAPKSKLEGNIYEPL